VSLKKPAKELVILIISDDPWDHKSWEQIEILGSTSGLQIRPRYPVFGSAGTTKVSGNDICPRLLYTEGGHLSLRRAFRTVIEQEYGSENSRGFVWVQASQGAFAVFIRKCYYV
jgi:hypothetical protein